MAGTLKSAAAINTGLISWLQTQFIKKMISAHGGIVNWVKRFFDSTKGFDRLNSVIQSKSFELNDDQWFEVGKLAIEELESRVKAVKEQKNLCG